ncbi:Enterobactin exporter EntS [Candidatus Hepatincola sp. Av]
MLINRNYTLLFIAQFITVLGNWLLLVAVPIYIFQTTGSSFMMSVAYAIEILATVFIMPFGGVFSDLINRHKILYGGDFISCLIALILVICLWFKPTSILLLLPLLFILAAIGSVQHPAFQGKVPEIVNKNQLGNANSYFAFINQFMSMLGPLIGVTIISFLGVINAIIVDAFSYLVSAIILLFIQYEYIKQATVINLAKIFSDLKKGWQYTFAHPLMGSATIMFTVYCISLGLIQGSIYFFLLHVLSFSNSQLGIVLAVRGLGAVIGALLTPKVNKYFAKGRFMLWCIILSAIGVSLHMATKNLIAISLLGGFCMFCEGMIAVTMFTLRHHTVPQNMLGKVVGISRPMSWATIPLGAVIGGYYIGINYYIVFIIAVISQLAAFAVGFFSPLNQSDKEIYKS